MLDTYRPTPRHPDSIPDAPRGVLSIAPRVLVCEQRHARADAASVGNPAVVDRHPGIVETLSHFGFHRGGWSSSDDDPRLCRPCRLARGCGCDRCENERSARR